MLRTYIHAPDGIKSWGLSSPQPPLSLSATQDAFLALPPPQPNSPLPTATFCPTLFSSAAILITRTTWTSRTARPPYRSDSLHHHRHQHRRRSQPPSRKPPRPVPFVEAQANPFPGPLPSAADSEPSILTSIASIATGGLTEFRPQAVLKKRGAERRHPRLRALRHRCLSLTSGAASKHSTLCARAPDDACIPRLRLRRRWRLAASS